MEHIAKTRIRYADTDQMGYVHHGKYFEYFEMGRTEYMRACGQSYADFEKGGLFLVLSEAHARYLAPARYDMEIAIRTCLKAISHAQVVFEYTVEGEDGKVFCQGDTRLACVDAEGKIRRIPKDMQRRLKGE